MHELICFYFCLRNGCVFDTSPISAFDMRRYFGVCIELTVNSIAFWDTLQVLRDFSLKRRPGKFTGKQNKNKPPILSVTYPHSQ